MAKAIELQQRFNEEIVPKLKEELGIKNNMAVPKITKIKVNVGMGTYIKSKSKDFSNIVENVTAITGQKPIVTRAKKAVSNFKVRENDPVGATVTLRGKRMYAFLNKLINIVFPRVRDFRGISPKAFDKNGNYSVGFKEHVVFPEISHDDVINLHGLQVTIVTNTDSDEEAFTLLKLLGFPFKKVSGKK